MSTIIDIEKVVATVNALEIDNNARWDTYGRQLDTEWVISEIKDRITSACRDAGVKGPWD